MACSATSSSANADRNNDFKLRVLSWNIDGLDEEDLYERTEAVITFIKHHSPQVVFLQEVVPQSLRRIHARLNKSYSIHHSPDIRGYFPAILITKDSPDKISIFGEVGVYEFPNTSMGRHLLHLVVNVCGVSFALYTSHLESMKDYSKQRIEQLKVSFEFLSEQSEKGRACIFGGDLNLRDFEIGKAGGLPKATVDIWEACGEKEQHRYTWDIGSNDNKEWPFPNRPHLRFDRMYLTSPSDASQPAVEHDDAQYHKVKPISFELVGKERVSSCGRFPSDHWGIYATFSID